MNKSMSINARNNGQKEKKLSQASLVIGDLVK